MIRLPSRFTTISLIVLSLTTFIPADVVSYELSIDQQPLQPAGRATAVYTINGSFPGPTLRFREGDVARITVHNRLTVDTLLHWHGLLVPNEQDGVPDITTPAIKPGSSFTYVFPIKQSGTYWYHSHAGFQEQKGLLGAIVITPRKGEPVNTERDHVLLMSDWTNESTNEVLRTLVRSSPAYSIKKATQQSLFGAYQAGAMHEYFEREKTRMPAMDISDVAYDAFLINGKCDHHLAGKPGDCVRLRLINGGAASYFYVESSTGDMTVIAADGQQVEPFKIKRLQMGNGETYDVTITIPAEGSWEVRATASDGSGHASAWIGDGARHVAADVPRADLYRMDAVLMENMEENAASQDRPASPYRQLRAINPTTFPAKARVRSMELRLTGDMQRYIWSFNGKTMNEESMIPVRKGEILRLELVNDTMMHHPIHLHGFFFRLINGQGAHAPLKHTVDVPPMGRQTIEFQANEQGDWMFHCHLLYHMASGMGRVISVGDGTCNPMMDMGEHGVIPTHVLLDGSMLSHMTDGTLSIQRERDSLNARWQAQIFEADASPYEIDFTYDHYFNSNFTALIGARFTDDQEDKNRALIGIDYRLPYLIDSSLELDSEGGMRVGLSKTMQLTNRLRAFASMHHDTRTDFEWISGLEYACSKQLSVMGQYHSDYGLGAGLGFHF